ncbi:hypothetical protein VB713_00165 [Anabaena cylindrica UHCC 0172]|uniref:hypothetical protein n=1 Tax=Anabaena cylindrica TaxID=1165 RepID=UPI002B21A146|nr:hypothetical protein [Anabaena cylindrica]MEA5549406.1 hypothetical protein [Anabaena cylindrica UHCC 0172]
MIFVVESKRNSIPVVAAISHLLAYMLTTLHPDKSVFGMATNGDEFIFIKLTLVDKS